MIQIIWTSNITKKQCDRIFMNQNLAVKVIMDCRTTSAHKFTTKLGFKQYDAILIKEQSVLIKLIGSFQSYEV